MIQRRVTYSKKKDKKEKFKLEEAFCRMKEDIIVSRRNMQLQQMKKLRVFFSFKQVDGKDVKD